MNWELISGVSSFLFAPILSLLSAHESWKQQSDIFIINLLASSQ
jgi:hypothetical protein